MYNKHPIQGLVMVTWSIFGEHFTFVKRFALCYQTVVCLSWLPVWDVGVLWPNGWMDQDETWHRGRPRPRPHCVRWEPSFPSPNGAHPQFLANVCCDQTARWIKMPFGTEVDLGQGDTVLDGDSAPPKGTQPPNFRPMSVLAKRLDGSRCHLVRR